MHLRTPHYLRGRRGTVVRHLGEFPNPEDLAFARPAARLPLYHVAFKPDGIWPGGARPSCWWRCSSHGCADLTLLRADSDRLLRAVRGLLEAKGILSADEIAERIRFTDAASPAQGAAWWRGPGSIPRTGR